MNVRNAWRFLGRLIGLLKVRDTAVIARFDRPVLLSCNDVDRGTTLDGKRFAPLLEGLREILVALGRETLNLSHPYAVLSSDRVKDGTITLNHRVFLLRLRTLWRRPWGAARMKAVRVEAEARHYVELLRKLDPEAVFSIQPPFAMCHAARQLGIPIVEAMHGSNIQLNDAIFRDHMAHPDHMLPQYILAFDDVTHATFTSHCAGRDIAVVRAADPWLHACRRLLAQRDADTPAAGATRTRRRVLLTLQWGYDGERESLRDIIPNGVLHPAVEAAIGAAARHDITFLLRMHPIQINAPGYAHHRRCIESVAARFPNVETERASADPLPLLLDTVCGHITMSSSAVGEAVAAGVPSLMLCPTLRPGGAHDGFFRELEGEGWVTFGALDAEEIVAWILRCTPSSERVRPAYDAEAEQRAQLRFYSELIARARLTSGTRAARTATAGVEQEACGVGR